MISARLVIAVPFFNEEPYLEETLQSLRAISPEDGEIMFFLCDNHSTDRSAEIAKRFAKLDPRFVLHRHEKNMGAIANFQFAFDQSASDYFMWLGAHDLIDPGYPRAALEAFSLNKEISYAAAEPYGFFDSVRKSKALKGAKYLKLSKNRVTRYFQSVERLENCTLVNSIFRRSCAQSFRWPMTVAPDHVCISHILWQGPLFYTKGQRYHRRLFMSTQKQREDKLVSESEQKPQLLYCDFFQAYVEDFERLYQGPSHCRKYLSQRMLDILASRFGLHCFDYSRTYRNL